MEEEFWKRLNSIKSSDLNFIYYYKLSIDLDYFDIEKLYRNYISKYYMDNTCESIFNNNESDKISLKIGLIEKSLSYFLEDSFEYNIRSLEDDLLIFYKKDSDKILILFKSFYPLIEIEDYRLPHFCYYLKDDDLIKCFSKLFLPDEKLIILSYTIKIRY